MKFYTLPPHLIETKVMDLMDAYEEDTLVLHCTAEEMDLGILCSDRSIYELGKKMMERRYGCTYKDTSIYSYDGRITHVEYMLGSLKDPHTLYFKTENAYPIKYSLKSQSLKGGETSSWSGVVTRGDKEWILKVQEC